VRRRAGNISDSLVTPPATRGNLSILPPRFLVGSLLQPFLGRLPCLFFFHIFFPKIFCFSYCPFSITSREAIAPSNDCVLVHLTIALLDGPFFGVFWRYFNVYPKGSLPFLCWFTKTIPPLKLDFVALFFLPVPYPQILAESRMFFSLLLVFFLCPAPPIVINFSFLDSLLASLFPLLLVPFGGSIRRTRLAPPQFPRYPFPRSHIPHFFLDPIVVALVRSFLWVSNPFSVNFLWPRSKSLTLAP